MAFRSRSRVLSRYHRGTYTTFLNGGLAGISYGGGPGDSGYESMSDTTGPVPYIPHALSKYKRKAEPLRLSGHVETPKGVTPRWEIDYNGYNPSNRSGYGNAPNPVAVNWTYWRTKALANLNPNKPAVDLPLFLFELREVPRMIRQLGRILQTGAPSRIDGGGGVRLTDASSAYLAYSFGWAPLIGDLIKLGNFAEEYENRLKYLRALSKQGGEKVSRSLGTSSSLTSSSSYEIPPPTGQTKPLFSATRQKKTVQKVWYTARVELLDESKIPESDDSFQLPALRAALGLNLSAASLWDAIPWTWAVDYFANIGDVLEAERGYLSFKTSNMCIMCKTVQTDSFESVSTLPGITYSGGTLTCEQKERQVYALPRPGLALRPIFTGHMAGILGSLATTKLLRSAGAR
nr:MAG: hypothetical protein 1 [Leviviridae sp.]